MAHLQLYSKTLPEKKLYQNEINIRVVMLSSRVLADRDVNVSKFVHLLVLRLINNPAVRVAGNLSLFPHYFNENCMDTLRFFTIRSNYST